MITNKLHVEFDRFQSRWSDLVACLVVRPHFQSGCLLLPSPKWFAFLQPESDSIWIS
jgi:hypothetical protein